MRAEKQAVSLSCGGLTSDMDKGEVVKKLISAVALAALYCASSVAFAGNYAECILDKMPGSMNQATTSAVHATCSKKHSEQFFDIKKGSGRLFGLFGFGDPESCTIKKSRETSHVYAANQIAMACRCLYGEPEFDIRSCSRVNFLLSRLYRPKKYF